MAYEVFTWPVSNNTAVDTTLKPLEVEFDGYRQAGADGLMLPDDLVNVEVGPLDMGPTDPNEATDCYGFLRRQKGLPFLWTPLRPLDQVQGLWTCSKSPIHFTRQGGFVVTLTAQFRRFNAP